MVAEGGAKIKKEVFIRQQFGKTFPELVQMSRKDLCNNLLTARVRRKFNRGLRSGERKLLAKCERAQVQKAKGHKVHPIKTHLRAMFIDPSMVGLNLAVYNGKVFNPIEVKLDMIGLKLGEFSPTYKFVKHRAMGKGATGGSKFTALK